MALLDNIPNLVRGSSTSVTLATTFQGQPTRITLGGRQRRVIDALALNTGSTGLGGLDTGALAANTLYYVYFCANAAGSHGLVASLTAPTTGPSGFTGRYRLLGKFRTDFGAATISLFGVATDANIQAQGTSGSDWITYVPSSYGGMASPTNVDARFRQLGDTAEISIKLTVQNVDGTVLKMALPTGLTAVARGAGGYVVDGNFGASYSGGDYAGVVPFILNSTPTFIQVGFNTFANVSTAFVANSILTNGSDFYLNATVPIAEWVGLFT